MDIFSAGVEVELRSGKGLEIDLQIVVRDPEGNADHVMTDILDFLQNYITAADGGDSFDTETVQGTNPVTACFWCGQYTCAGCI